jgi:RimJ/RimL family protein N-acetyltransferase
METLVTPRLHLRPVCAADKPFVMAGLNDLAVSRWLSVVPHPYGAADFDAFLQGMARPGAVWTIEGREGAFCGIVDIADGRLGYWLLPAAHGRGIMTEAAGAVVDAFLAAGGGPVVSGYFEGNLPSSRVLARLGFTETGRDVKFCRPQGRDLPHVSLILPRSVPAAVPSIA